MMCLCCLNATFAAKPERPKLVVGIIVDQMRWDYLYRYYDSWDGGGMRRLIDQGFSCENHLVNYVPTVTCLGHTSAYTGTVPAIHGITDNSYRDDDHEIYCASDASAKTVGSSTKAGEMSPLNNRVTTIGDQLRMATSFKSRVFGISLKDRASIMPAGHCANGAFWYDKKERRFITSTYYMDKLPKYIETLNKQNHWTDSIMNSPEGMKATTDAAVAIIQGENLGKGESTDMICISYSPTDYVGHEWGTVGWHTDRIYSSLNSEMSRLLSALDKQVGKGNYLLFLTADHAASHSSTYLRDHKVPSGEWNWKTTLKPSPLFHVYGYQVRVDKHEAARRGLCVEQVKDSLIRELEKDERIMRAVDMKKVNQITLPERIRESLLNAYTPDHSGDIFVVMQTGYYYGDEKYRGGTTHGSWNPYDSHIPMLFYGWHIAEGKETHVHSKMVDLAATVCAMLHIQMPNGCIGTPILPVMGE